MLEVVLIHDVLDNLVFCLIDDKRFTTANGPISETGCCLVAVLQRFFLHAAQDFTG